MKLGFNSNVALEDKRYHVQTEDRGADHPYIDTVVLSQGRVLHRCSTSYHDLLAAGAPDLEILRARVEAQHRDVLQALNSGSLPLEDPEPPAGVSEAIELKLRNTESWRAGDSAILDLEVFSKDDGQPVAGAEVTAVIEGTAGEPAKAFAHTDDAGRATLRLAIPKFGDQDAPVLVIQARISQGWTQLRYQLKRKVQVSGSPPLP